MTSLRSLLVVLALASTTALWARQAAVDNLTDSITRSHRIIEFGKGPDLQPDSAYSLIARFYTDQFRHFQDPLAPYFLFMSKSSELAMGIGGCVRMRGYYDWGGAIPASGFAPYLIPMTPDRLRQKQLGTTPSGTAIFFRVIGTNKRLGNYQLYIEANFNGYSARDFHLKKAYAEINDWTIGYASSTFSDPGALPPTVDAQGPNCKMSQTAVLVRWMHSLPHGFTIAASLETPAKAGIATDSATAARTQYIPDGAAFVQYSWGRSNHIRLAGIVRALPYCDLLTDRDHTPAGWGVQLSTAFHPAYPLTIYGAINGGKGYAGLGGDWMMGNYDLVGGPTPGRLHAPGAYGGYIAVQYNFRPNIFASATFGATRYCGGSEASPSEYRRGMYMAVNAFWNITARIQAGAEFNLGNRQNYSGETKWARRVGLMAQFSF